MQVRGRRAPVVAVAVLVIAALAGAAAGFAAPWATAALVAAGLAGQVLIVLWLRTQLQDLRARLGREYVAVDRVAKSQKRTLTQVRKLTEQIGATERSLRRSQRAALDATLKSQNVVYRSMRRHVHDAHLATAKSVDRRAAAERKFLAKTTALEGSRTRRHAETMFRQTEALQNLHRLLHVRGSVGPSRGWALSPDVLLTYVQQILANKPAYVVESGSGLSTVWAAYALESVGGGRVIALEHEQSYAAQTRRLLAEHGLSGFAEVRHAPLTEIEIDGQDWVWYDPVALEDVNDIGVALIDGPPRTTAEHARYPALPLLRDKLAPGAVVVADDTDRPDETVIVERWLAEWPQLVSEHLRHEKGAVLLRTPATS